MYHLSTMRNAATFNKVIFPVQVQRSVLADNKLQEIKYVLTIKFACITRHGTWQVAVTNYANTLKLNRFLVDGAGRIAPGCSRKIYDDRARPHGLLRFLTNEQWRLFTWYLCCCNNDIGLADAFGDPALLFLLVFFALLYCISTSC